MPSCLPRIVACLLPILFVLTASSWAQDDAEEIKKQKDTATANMAKLKIEKPVLIETTNLILTSGLQEAKAKVFADQLQKQYDLAYKALQFDPSDTPWKGKLTLYMFTDRSQFTSFVRTVERRSPDSDDHESIQLTGDTPHIAISLPGIGGNGSEVALRISEALMIRRGGTASFPSWMRDGFSKAVWHKADLKASAKAKLELKKMISPKPTIKLADAWGANVDAEKRLMISASFMEYLSFGPETKNFPKFMNAFKPADGANPGINAALEALGPKQEEIEKKWQKWVLTGK